MANFKYNPADLHERIDPTPMPRVGDPQDLAGAAIFLASDAFKLCHRPVIASGRGINPLAWLGLTAPDFTTFKKSLKSCIFRIIVLAYQALLHDARGEESAVVEKLSQALSLAEPGGFIRLFVDLESQMADLLKRLIKKNVAVKYVERILSAYREDAHHPIPLIAVRLRINGTDHGVLE